MLFTLLVDIKIEIVKKVPKASLLILRCTNKEFASIVNEHCEYHPRNWLDDFSTENGSLLIWYLSVGSVINYNDYYLAILKVIKGGQAETLLEWAKYLSLNGRHKKSPHHKGLSRTSWIEDIAGELLYRLHMENWRCTQRYDETCINITVPYPIDSWKKSKRNSKKYERKICSRWFAVIKFCLNFLLAIERQKMQISPSEFLEEIAWNYSFNDDAIEKWNKTGVKNDKVLM